MGIQEMNLMIDLETLGVSPSSPVISIGAVFFDREGLKEDFYITLGLEEQFEKGRKMDAGTLQWWMSQDEAAKNVFKENPFVVEYGLLKFQDFCLKYNAKPWGNGATFDIVILENIFSMFGVTVPWNFRNIRDYRTFSQLFPNEIEREGTYHNALDDAKHQARNVIANLESTQFNI